MSDRGLLNRDVFRMHSLTRLALFALVACSLFSSSSTLLAQGLPDLKVTGAIYELNEDGTGWRKVIVPGDYARIGSLRLAPDGSRLTFDGIKPGGAWSDAVLLSCRLDGSDLKVHGGGGMPNFSPDNRRVSFCSYPENAVKVLDLQAQTEQLIERGWGVQWCPVNNQIAYVVSGDVVIRNVDTGERRLLFPEGGSPYQSVQYNMAWSHDGQRLAIQGQRMGGGKEIAVVDAQGAEFGFTVVTLMKATSNFLAFHPSGGKLAFQHNHTPSKCSQLFTVDVGEMKEPQRIAGQPEDFDNVSLTWIEGGRKMRIISWQR